MSLIVLAGCVYMAWGQKPPPKPKTLRDLLTNPRDVQTYEAAAKLKKGMSYDEALALLGKPSETTGIHSDPNDWDKTGAYARDDLWFGDRVHIGLCFTERKFGPHPAGTMRLLDKSVEIIGDWAGARPVAVPDPAFDQ